MNKISGNELDTIVIQTFNKIDKLKNGNQKI
jgi:hypothetical protein